MSATLGVRRAGRARRLDRFLYAARAHDVSSHRCLEARTGDDRQVLDAAGSSASRKSSIRCIGSRDGLRRDSYGLRDDDLLLHVAVGEVQAQKTRRSQTSSNHAPSPAAANAPVTRNGAIGNDGVRRPVRTLRPVKKKSPALGAPCDEPETVSFRRGARRRWRWRWRRTDEHVVAPASAVRANRPGSTHPVPVERLHREVDDRGASEA